MQCDQSSMGTQGPHSCSADSKALDQNAKADFSHGAHVILYFLTGLSAYIFVYAQ